MGWYGGTVVRRLRHRQMSEALRQPVPVGGYAPVLLAGCLVRPCLGDHASLTTNSLLPGQAYAAELTWRLEVHRLAMAAVHKLEACRLVAAVSWTAFQQEWQLAIGDT